MKKPDLPLLLGTLLILLYPLLIWSAHAHLEPRQLALLLLAIGAVRLFAARLSAKLLWPGLAALLLAAPALLWNDLLPLQLYPVLISLGMLVLFGASLVRPPPIIERLARLREPVLPPFAIAHTRRVTQVWCVFFALNGATAMGTALWASPAVWSMYTGVVSYLIMGILFAGEYLVRIYLKRQHHA